MQTSRKSVVITSNYSPTISTLYDIGKIFVNTDSNITIKLPTADDDLDVYIKNLGNGVTTVNRTLGTPVTTRDNRKFDGYDSVLIYKNQTYLISYVKDLDSYQVL